MARYTGPRLRLIRRLGALPGLTSKQTDRKGGPGQHGLQPKKLQGYALQLLEKQKLRFNYGVSERQLQRCVELARKAQGKTGEVLLQMMEMRLDNIVFRMGFAPTIPAARQLVRHGHIRVNGRRVNMPAYRCTPGTVVEAHSASASRELVARHLALAAPEGVPTHLAVDKTALMGRVLAVAARDSVKLDVKEQLIVEYYAIRG